MKFVFGVFTTLFLISLSASAHNQKPDTLNGKKFCRIINSRDGLFGRPCGVTGEHCVSFLQGKMHDNADTFFGNPPTNSPYKLIDTGAIYATNKNGKWEKSGYVYLDGEMTYNYINMDIVSTIL